MSGVRDRDRPFFSAEVVRHPEQTEEADEAGVAAAAG
jgi:hypothetical protein